jgi:hypothetical protein
MISSKEFSAAKPKRSARVASRAGPKVSTMRMIDSSGSRRIRYLGSFWDKEL